LSSILNALKRLEQERPKRAYPRIWVRKGNDAANDWRIWLGGLLAVILLVGAGGAAYYKLIGSPGEESADPDAHHVQELKLATGASNEAGRTKFAPKAVTADGGQQSVVRTKPAPTKAVPLVAVQRQPATTQKRSTYSHEASGPSKALPQVHDAPQPSAQVAPKEALTQTQGKDVRKTSSQPSDPSAPIKPETPSTDLRSANDVDPGTALTPALPTTLLTNTTLKIQAISWSQTPQDRIAVVNSQLVREGEAIDGYRVKQINPDDMILSRDGLDWMLRFVHQ